MKILLVCNKSPWPPKDGGSLATFQMAKALAKSGSQVTILAINTSRHPVKVESIPLEIKDLINFYFVEMDTTIKIRRLIADFLLPGKPYIAKRFFSETFLKTLQKLVSVEDFNIVQFEGLYTLQYKPFVQIPGNTKISYRPHNAEHKIWENLARNETNPFKKIYFKRLSEKLKTFEKELMNRYDFLVPISDLDNNTFKQLGNTKPAMTSSFGIFPDEFPSYKTTPNHHLFYIGALDWIPNREGLEWFVKKVWPKAKNKHPKLMFFVAGRNMPHSFKKVLRMDGIYYEGEVEDSAQFIQKYGIMVVPLLSGGGMRVKIIEGMAQGKPLIATSKAAEGIKVVHNNNILIADTVNEFCTAIDKYISEPDFAAKTGSEARLFALTNFNNFDIAQSLIRFYQSTC